MSYDPNMDFLYRWARGYPNKPILPGTLWEVVNRAKFLDFVDKELIAGTETWRLNSIQLDAFRSNIENITSTSIIDVQKPVDRFIITTVLWSGCIDGAKVIRDNKVVGVVDSPQGQRVLEEPITPSERLAMSKKVELFSIPDCLYRYGVEASPIIRKIRSQKIVHEGIPDDSTLMKIIRPYM